MPGFHHVIIWTPQLLDSTRPDSWSSGAVSGWELRGSYFNLPPLNPVNGERKLTWDQGFTGLRVWSPRLCPQTNGPLHFRLSSVEQRCSGAEMKHGAGDALLHLYTHLILPLPSYIPRFFSPLCAARLDSSLASPADSPNSVAGRWGGWGLDGCSSFLNEVTPKQRRCERNEMRRQCRSVCNVRQR